MPSASSKTENKAPLEVTDPFKAAQNVVEKKLRNLEKRKGKIEIIREKRDLGEDINADQQKAIDCYEGVLTSLEVTKDLQKQFAEIQTEIDKYAKKKARLEKKEKADKRAFDVKRARDILEIQSLLDCMGTDSVRSHFKIGKHKAKVLTEENLNELDEFYKLISPSRDDDKYQEQVTDAAEHLFSYLEGREADAAGTTYKDLRNLIDGILNCGYFDSYPYEEEVDHTEAQEPAAEPQADIEALPTNEEQLHEVPEVRQDEPVPSLEQLQQHVPHSHPALPTQAPTQLQTPADLLPPQLNNVDNGGPQYQQANEDSYFSVEGFPNNQRPFQDIVSSVQGKFNFLQESQISSESAAHMDPAVVVAQPMRKSNADVLHGGSFQGVSMLGEDQLSHLTNQQQSSPQQAVMVEHRAADPSQSPLDSTTSYNPHSQDYSQNLISQSTYSAEQSNPSLVGHSHSAMDQAVVMGGPDMPPSIPLPNQSTPTSSSLQDQAMSQENQEKKPFAMNPNAAMFQSMYNTNLQSGHSQSGGPPNMTANNNASQSQMAAPVAGDKSLPNSDYSNGFGGSSYSGRSANGGPPRGGAMRGGSGGRGGRGSGMSNGYTRTSSRGGGYNSGRGGGSSYSSNRGAGGRGGGGAMRGGPARGGSSERGSRGPARGSGYSARPN